MEVLSSLVEAVGEVETAGSFDFQDQQHRLLPVHGVFILFEDGLQVEQRFVVVLDCQNKVALLHSDVSVEPFYVRQ